jgi:hypothetical protein
MSQHLEPLREEPLQDIAFCLPQLQREQGKKGGNNEQKGG